MGSSPKVEQGLVQPRYSLGSTPFVRKSSQLNQNSRYSSLHHFGLRLIEAISRRSALRTSDEAKTRNLTGKKTSDRDNGMLATAKGGPLRLICPASLHRWTRSTRMAWSLLVPDPCEIFGRATLIIVEHTDPDFGVHVLQLATMGLERFVYLKTRAGFEAISTIWLTKLIRISWKNCTDRWGASTLVIFDEKDRLDTESENAMMPRRSSQISMASKPDERAAMTIHETSEMEPTMTRSRTSISADRRHPHLVMLAFLRSGFTGRSPSSIPHTVEFDYTTLSTLSTLPGPSSFAKGCQSARRRLVTTRVETASHCRAFVPPTGPAKPCQRPAGNVTMSRRSRLFDDGSKFVVNYPLINIPPPRAQNLCLRTLNFYLICPSASEWNPVTVSRAVSRDPGPLPNKAWWHGLDALPYSERFSREFRGVWARLNLHQNQSAAYLAQARWSGPATSHASRLRIYTILASFSNLLQNDMGWPLSFPGTLPPLNLVRHHRRPHRRRAPNNQIYQSGPGSPIACSCMIHSRRLCRRETGLGLCNFLARGVSPSPGHRSGPANPFETIENQSHLWKARLCWCTQPASSSRQINASTDLSLSKTCHPEYRQVCIRITRMSGQTFIFSLLISISSSLQPSFICLSFRHEPGAPTRPFTL
ncbi:uncharacterized protein CLUP02_10448 [Colletotrichum lupini]|uniref:Uncharacterized protein n=1 Tax=Colletotrichum lupini TaxID=145971 RepID=A0A9Q8WJD4_9PEZI|nr:uncharacterized protein CLUP02_10448 [Colletotrichum lupini]UQC84952.1 hypothetical protein CLUP02_10448 [Colletotrichum lupini]